VSPEVFAMDSAEPPGAVSDYHRRILRDQVIALVAIESAIEESLNLQSALTQTHPQLHASLEALRTEADAQRQGLVNYLRDNGVESTVPQSPIATLLAQASSSGNLSTLLSVDYAAFNFAASEYSILLEFALRLYDLALRKLAPQHLRTYAGAIQMLSYRLPRVVIEQLNAQGMACRCICPMCSIGACGCMAAAHAWVDEAWHDTRPQMADEPGFPLTLPRQGSQLAERGVRAGDRLLEVDGAPISTFLDVQRAIRKHQIGEELAFRVVRGSEPAHEIRVRHVSDYPPG
jgi:hypothetical protein